MARDNILQKTIKAQKLKEEMKKGGHEWYNLRPVLGCANWAIFYVLLGGREAGKSYSVTNFLVDQFVNKGIPFVWMRLTDTQSRKLLTNNAEKLVDPDLKRKYNLNLRTIGTNVYNVITETKTIKHRDGTTEEKEIIIEKKLMARVLSLSTFYTDKGSIFDKDFLNDPNMRYNIAVDEFQQEKGEKRTFDILYAFTNQLENLVRSTKDRIKVFLMGNTLEEASDILCAFNFIPEQWGTYKIKKKRCVIQYIEPSEAYLKRRKGTIADILMPEASTFTNKIETDKTLITKQRLKSPNAIIKFSKMKSDWYTIWDGNIICKFNGEKGKRVIAMRPYLDEVYNQDLVNNILLLFDTRCLQFRNLITFKRFQAELALLKPRKS